MMKNTANYYLFLEGQEAALLQLSDHTVRSSIQNLSIFYRLGVLYVKAKERPKLLQLYMELYREFSFCNSSLPNMADICLYNKYSHRLLKEAFDSLGYRIPVNPDYSGFHAWRVS